MRLGFWLAVFVFPIVYFFTGDLLESLFRWSVICAVGTGIAYVIGPAPDEKP